VGKHPTTTPRKTYNNIRQSVNIIKDAKIAVKQGYWRQRPFTTTVRINYNMHHY
jgi:hypothetical protein